MGLKLVEPLRDLFKDEVREVGRELGMAEELVDRQPFPGPGLAVRILGDITKDRLDVLREADWLIMDIAKKSGVYKKTWQIFQRIFCANWRSIRSRKLTRCWSSRW